MLRVSAVQRYRSSSGGAQFDTILAMKSVDNIPIERTVLKMPSRSVANMETLMRPANLVFSLVIATLCWLGTAHAAQVSPCPLALDAKRPVTVVLDISNPSDAVVSSMLNFAKSKNIEMTATVVVSQSNPVRKTTIHITRRDVLQTPELFGQLTEIAKIASSDGVSVSCSVTQTAH